jgi:hypothetical protein
MVLGLLAPGAANAVPAACPTDICGCLGSAAQFSIAGGALQIKSGKINSDGYGYVVGSSIEGSVCGSTAQVGGKAGGETSISGDLVATATSGVAVKFKGSKNYGYAYPGAFIDGDLVTGGGSISGEEFGEVAGSTSATVSDARVGACNQAVSDAAAASAAFAALTPTQTLTKLTVDKGNTYELNAGAGTYVISIDDVVLKPLKYMGGAEGSILNINLDATTDTVIINVKGKLAVGTACEINVVGGDIEDVIINVIGTAPTVKIKPDAFVVPAILAPQRKYLASGNAFVSNVYAAGVKIKGAQLEEPLLCE